METQGAVGEMKALFERLSTAQASAQERSAEALAMAGKACERLAEAGATRVDALTSITLTTPGRAQLKARLATSPEDARARVGLDRGAHYQIPNRLDVTVEYDGEVSHFETLAVVDTAERLTFALVRRKANDEERAGMRAHTESGGTAERLTSDWAYRAVAREAQAGEALSSGEAGERALAEHWARALVTAETGIAKRAAASRARASKERAYPGEGDAKPDETPGAQAMGLNAKNAGDETMPEERPLEAEKPKRENYTGDPEYPLNEELQNVLFALAEYAWKLQSMRAWLDAGVEWRTETNPEGENFRQAKVEGDIEEFHTIVETFQHFVDGELD